MLSKKKPFVDSPSSASQGKDKKLKKMVFPGTGTQVLALPETETAENDEDYEPTAMLGMMSEFQREAGITAPKEAVNSSKHMLQASLSVSTVIFSHVSPKTMAHKLLIIQNRAHIQFRFNNWLNHGYDCVRLKSNP